MKRKKEILNEDGAKAAASHSELHSLRVEGGITNLYFSLPSLSEVWEEFFVCFLFPTSDTKLPCVFADIFSYIRKESAIVFVSVSAKREYCLDFLPKHLQNLVQHEE